MIPNIWCKDVSITNEENIIGNKYAANSESFQIVQKYLRLYGSKYLQHSNIKLGESRVESHELAMDIPGKDGKESLWLVNDKMYNSYVLLNQCSLNH